MWKVFVYPTIFKFFIFIIKNASMQRELFYSPKGIYSRQNLRKSSLVAVHNIRDNRCMKRVRDRDLFEYLSLASQTRAFFLSWTNTAWSASDCYKIFTKYLNQRVIFPPLFLSLTIIYTFNWILIYFNLNFIEFIYWILIYFDYLLQ